MPTLFDHIGTRFAGGGSPLSVTGFTVTGNNPALIVHIAAYSQQFNDRQYGTGVTWSLDGRSFTKIAEKRNTVDAQAVVVQSWVLPAPAAGTGTVQATFNVAGAASDCQIMVELWIDAHQTTPCPTGDVVQKDTDESPSTATPTNLAASDATSAACSCSDGGISATSPNVSHANGNNPATACGYASGTTGVTFTFAGLGHSNHAMTAVRIVPAGLSMVPTAAAASMAGVATGRVLGTVVTPATP